jgi:homoserine dehydrogenase
VTSNKELVAKHGYELLQIAKERGVNYLFEASVGGGIPILRPISQCLAANRINEIYGILNGTTNYILTAMIKDGVSFDDALKQAQEKGYAEQNPSSDIDGIDACRKICILADLCFGRHMEPDWVKTVGIRAVTAEDVTIAGGLGYKIKLLGRAVAVGDDKFSAYVAPHLVPDGDMLASVDGVMNGIVVRGNAIGDVLFYGAGAGKLPTASAVVADIIDAAKHDHARKLISWNSGSEDMMLPSSELKSRWYARVDGDHGLITAEKQTKTEVEALLAAFDVSSLFRVLD